MQAMVQPHYDSLIAKLIVFAGDRDAAIVRMQGALEEFVVEGIRTTLPLSRELLALSEFADNRFHTGFVDEWLRSRTD